MLGLVIEWVAIGVADSVPLLVLLVWKVRQVMLSAPTDWDVPIVLQKRQPNADHYPG